MLCVTLRRERSHDLSTRSLSVRSMPAENEAVLGWCSWTRKESLMPEFSTTFFTLGAVGGLLPDAIRFAKGRHKGFPEWFLYWGYWFGLAMLVVLGGLAAWLGEAQNWKSAIALGF